jgi:hypothetical protein
MLRVQLRPLNMMLQGIPVSARLFLAGKAPVAPVGGGGRRSIHAGESANTWRKPDAGRLKLNFDGSSKHTSRRASIGGVYRDHEGGFVLGYAERIGKATSSVAELAALRRGLELALENGWLNISIEGDAKTVVDVVRNRVLIRAEEDLRQCEEIAALLPLLDDGGMAVSHVRRAGNRVAHGFAKLGHGVARPRVWRGVPPDEVLRYLQRDADGK